MQYESNAYVTSSPPQPTGGAHWWLSQVRLEAVDGHYESKGGTKSDDIDDGAYADRTLHTALTFLHGSYNIKNLTNMVGKKGSSVLVQRKAFSGFNNMDGLGFYNDNFLSSSKKQELTRP